jgi:hypothetical protein
MRTSLILSTAFAVLFSFQAHAEVPANEPMTCPVGGERFTHRGYAAYSTYGARLDGKPHGSTSFPLRIPVCPNGFVIYQGSDAFTPDLIARLEPVVRSAEYRALIDAETTYFRAAYLARAGGAPAEPQAWLLLQATWQVDGEPPRHARYQEAFLEAGTRALAELDRTKRSWWMLQFRMTNAERQLARFEAAQARLDALELDKLPTSTGEDYPSDEEWNSGYRSGIDVLRNAVVARDAALEPASASRARR